MDIGQAIIVAVVTTSGFWTFLQFVLETKSKKRQQSLNNVFEKLEEIGKKLDDTADLSLSYSRERLNCLCNQYSKQGYIPLDGNVAFRCLGNSYCKVGNTEIAESFKYCINNLPVIDDSDKN